MVDYSFITNIFTNLNILGITWIVPTIVSVITLIAITRDTEEIKSLLFPVMFGFHSIGLRQNFALLALAGIIYVQEGLSISVVGTAIKAVSTVRDASTRAYNIATQRSLIKDKFDERLMERFKRRKELSDVFNVGVLESKVKKKELMRRNTLLDSGLDLTSIANRRPGLSTLDEFSQRNIRPKTLEEAKKLFDYDREYDAFQKRISRMRPSKVFKDIDMDRFTRTFRPKNIKDALQLKYEEEYNNYLKRMGYN